MRRLAQVLGLLALAAVFVQGEKRRYDGYKLYKVYPLTKSQIDFVGEMSGDTEIQFWYEGPDRVDIMVPPTLQEGFAYQLSSRDIRYDVAENNLQDLLDMEELQMLERNVEPGRAVDYFNWNTYENIMAELRILEGRCPPGFRCTVETVGQSHLGRNIDALRIASGTGKRMIWIDATIHAREWLATATILLIMRRFIDESNNPAVINILNRFDIYFIPVMNPDGYSYSHTNDRLWRKNRRPNAGSTCIGTDLNRNYNQMWGNAGAATNPCSETYRGTSAGSEPETVVVQAQLRNFGSNLLFSMHIHTYGQLWLIPWGSQVGTNQCNIASDHNQMMITANAGANAVAGTYGTTWNRGNSCATIYPASGITMDYSKGVGGVFFTVTPELRGGNFVVNVNQINPSFLEVWNGVVATINSLALQ